MEGWHNMKLRIDSRDLHYTIDTYGMFTGEHCEEGEIEYYQENYKLTDDEAGEIEFNYDHAGVVKHLAEASVNLLWNEFVKHGDGTVKNIDLDDTKSPQFYNYTTDSYMAVWEVNTDMLKQYIADNQDAFTDFVTSNWDYEYSKAVAESDEETQAVIAVDFYTSSEYDREEYEMLMFECESEAWLENMTLDKKTQALIDSKEQK